MRRDSGGVEIVENWISEDATTHRRLTITASVAPDASDAADLSGRIVDATRRSDGGIILGDRQTSSLALFDSTGRFVRLLGRRGEGPGEFQRISRVMRLRNDTIAVIDLDQGRRITRLLNDGTLIDSRLLPLQPLQSPDTRVPSRMGDFQFVLGVMHNGALLSYIHSNWILLPPGRGKGKLEHDSMIVRSLGLPAGRAINLARFPRGTSFFYENVQGTTWNRPAPFSAQGHVAVGGAGFYYGWGGRYEVAEYAADGRLARLIRVCLGSGVVDESLVARYRSLSDAQVPERYRRLAREALELAPIPKQTPAFTDLLEDGHGYLWIGEFHLENEPQIWRVIDPSGEVVTSIEISGGVRLVEVGPNHLLGVQTDADDLQTIVVYRLAEGFARKS